PIEKNHPSQRINIDRIGFQFKTSPAKQPFYSYIDEADLRRQEENPRNRKEQSWHSHWNQEQAPGQISIRHVRPFGEPGKQNRQGNRYERACPGKQKRVQNHPVGQWVGVRDHVVLERKRPRNRGMTGAKTVYDQLADGK